MWFTFSSLNQSLYIIHDQREILMASLTHFLVGAAAGQHLAGKPTMRPMVWMSMLSFCPDFDVIAFTFGIPYSSPWGHRGFTHSISFAILMGVLIWLLRTLISTQNSKPKYGSLYWGLIAMLVTLSHPILDAFTNGGMGVALWWPFSEERIFFYPQWIPVSPLGTNILSTRGAYVIAFEAVICLPLWIYLLMPWVRRKSSSNP